VTDLIQEMIDRAFAEPANERFIAQQHPSEVW